MSTAVRGLGRAGQGAVLNRAVGDDLMKKVRLTQTLEGDEGVN